MTGRLVMWGGLDDGSNVRVFALVITGGNAHSCYTCYSKIRRGK